MEKRHMAVSIKGLLLHYKKKKINGLLEDKGRRLSDSEARLFLNECQNKGWNYFANGDCEGFDPVNGKCPGHKISEPIQDKP